MPDQEFNIWKGRVGWPDQKLRGRQERKDSRGKPPRERHQRKNNKGKTPKERHQRKDTKERHKGKTPKERHQRKDTKGKTRPGRLPPGAVETDGRDHMGRYTGPNKQNTMNGAFKVCRLASPGPPASGFPDSQDFQYSPMRTSAGVYDIDWHGRRKK